MAVNTKNYFVFGLIFIINIHTAAAQGVETGIAADYPNDIGITDHPSVIFASGMETPDWYVDDLNYSGTLREGYEHTTEPSIVLTGEGCLQIQQTEGTHNPYEFHPDLPDLDTVYLRWYRKYEEGYQWTQHKMPGVYATAPGYPGGGAGEKPDGYDKYSCKLFVDWEARPAFYSYHPDQAGGYGDHFPQNIGEPVVLETERWYCFEMMLQSNTAGEHDGELKMWIDGVLKGHVTGLRFRETDILKINEFTHSAYVGGTWVSERDQKLWEDNLVIATEYIGPLNVCGVPEVLCVDDTPGDTQEYDNIQDAIDAATPGATVLIFDGVHNPSGSLRVRSGPLTIKSYNKYGAKIIAPTDDSGFDHAMFVCNWADGHCQDTDFDLVIDGLDISGGYVYTIQVTSAHNVTIKNSKIHGPGREGIKINGDNGHSQNVIVEDCEIYDTGVRDDSNAEGVDICSSYNITLRNNYFHDIATCGFYAKKESRDILFDSNIVENANCGIGLGQSSACTNCEARNNLIMGTEDLGIQARGSVGGRIYHNTLYDVARSGAAAIWIAQDDYDTMTENLELYNNIIYMDSARPVFQMGSDSMPSIDELSANNNIWFNEQGVKFRISPTDRDLDEWRTYSGEESNSTEANPLFESLGSDFHLTEDSPAVDKGAHVGVLYDYDGNLRPNGNGFDIGCYESGYAVSVPQCTDADTDISGVIENDEINIYIESWMHGGVEIPDLLEVIDKWKNGC